MSGQFSIARMGQRIRQCREALGMSQAELAAKVGYKSRSSINKIELGKNDIGQNTLEKLADALQTTPSYLMGWEDALVDSLKEDSKTGRTQAKEDMYRTFGTDHATASTRVLGDNLVAVLYYRAMNPYAAAELLDLIDAVDGMDYQKLGDIRLMVRAYLRSTDAIREIVDTALKPYREEQEEADWTG